MEAFACGLSPDEFWRSTPAEIYLVMRGRGKSLESFHQLTAWHAALILNCWSDERVTPDQLLGKSTRVDLLELADRPGELQKLLGRGEADDDGV